jgi:hypothetical protein
VKTRQLPQGATQPEPVNLPDKTRVIVIQQGTDPRQRRVIPISILDGVADKDGVWTTHHRRHIVANSSGSKNDERHRGHRSAKPGKHRRLFVLVPWHAMHPEDAVIAR